MNADREIQRETPRDGREREREKDHLGRKWRADRDPKIHRHQV